MLRCNLAVLLAERNLRITQVSNDTKISRTTLTSLSNNSSQGIQFNTLNTLCNYLKVSPEVLLSYYPMDVETAVFPRETIHTNKTVISVICNFHILQRGVDEKFSLSGTANYKFNNSSESEKIESLQYLNIVFDFSPIKFDNNEKELFLRLMTHLNSLPVTFLSDIESDIVFNLAKRLGVKIVDSFEVHWPK